MPTVEINIVIRVDPDGTGGGISGNAETVVDEIYYVIDPDLDGVFNAASEALHTAMVVCDERAEAAYVTMMENR